MLKIRMDSMVKVRVSPMGRIIYVNSLLQAMKTGDADKFEEVHPDGTRYEDSQWMSMPLYMLMQIFGPYMAPDALSPSADFCLYMDARDIDITTMEEDAHEHERRAEEGQAGQDDHAAP
ncbi:MAG: hypothetical protein LUD50_04535 [Clostridia bacterium]|nr:hypothetical protein [Clostridia bacterium]